MPRLKQELSGSDSNIRVERIYAKSIGVKSPTVLTKAQLDEAVRVRELELGITKDKSNIYDFTPDERRSLTPRASSKTRIQMFTGWFRAFPEGDGVLRRDPYRSIPETDAYVCKEYVDEYGMRAGDRVVGSVSVVAYNNVRVMKNIKFVNEHTTVRPVVRKCFDTMPSVPVFEQVKAGSNSAICGIVQNMLNLGVGQSLAVMGKSESNRLLFERMAIELIKGLYMRFNGDVYGIFENISPENMNGLTHVINPESILVDGDRAEYPFMLEAMKRSVERGVSAILVLCADGLDVSSYIQAACAKEKAGLSVVVFSQGDEGAQATLSFNGEKLIAEGVYNPQSALICGKDNHKRIYRALSELADDSPDKLYAKFMELMNE